MSNLRRRLISNERAGWRPALRRGTGLEGQGQDARQEAAKGK